MSKKLEPKLLHRKSKRAAALREAIKQGAVGLTAVLAEIAAQGSGTAAGTLAAMVVSATSEYQERLGQVAIEKLITRLDERIAHLEQESDKTVTLGYIFSDQYLLEVRYMLNSLDVLRANEKIDAALNQLVNVAMARGKDDAVLRDFVSAFLRDATTMDIRVLNSLSPYGRYDLSTDLAEDSKRGNSTLSNIEKALNLKLGVKDALDLGLVRASIGRLYGLGLCMAYTRYDAAGLSPVQRTELGESVSTQIKSRAVD